MSSRERVSADAVFLALSEAKIGFWDWDTGSGIRWSEETEWLFGIETGTYPRTFEEYTLLLPEEDRRRVLATLDEAMSGEKPNFIVSHWTAPRNGAPRRFLESYGTVRRNDAGNVVGMSGIVLDRTNERVAQATAAETLRQLNVVRTLTSDYVYEVDLEREAPISRVIAGSFQNTTGYDENKLLPDEWSSLIYEEDRFVERAVNEAIEKNVPVVVEYRIHDAWGGMKWLRDRIVPVATGGQVTRVLGIVQDITEKKLLESQVLHSQKMEALAQMAGSVAHDFNNLLTVMVASLAAVRANVDVEAALGDLDDALARGSEIAQSLLAFGRRQVTILHSLELCDALRRARTIVQRAVGSELEISLELPDERVFVQADLGQLELMLLNLVINARDAEPRDRRVVIRLRKLDFAASDAGRPPELESGPYAEVSVIDRGAGIPPEIQGRIFEPFYTTKEPGHGTGLGLSTVHGIARSWGGSMKVESGLGVGTSISVLLPLGRSKITEIPLSSNVRGGLGGSELVLLVEDDHLVRRAALRTLREYGYQVREYASAEALLEEDQDTILAAALLLSDVRLGGLDGISLASEMRVHRPDLPVLLMSGYVEHEAQQEILREGRYSFLPKPFTPDGLVHKVREVLDQPLTEYGTATGR